MGDSQAARDARSRRRMIAGDAEPARAERRRTADPSGHALAPVATGRAGGFVARAWTDRSRFTLERLLRRSGETGARTPFQRADFLEPFYMYAAASLEPVLVELAHEDDEQALMIVPLLLRRAGGLRYIEGADLGLADHVGPLLAEGFRPGPRDLAPIRRAVIEALPPADVLSFKKMPAELAPGVPNPLVGLHGAVEMGISTRRLDLRDPAGAEHYRRSGLYKDGMRQLRKLGKLGEVEFRVAATAAEALSLFEELLAQRRERFEALGRPDPLSQPGIRAFYSTMIEAGVPRGEVLFGGLFLDGECIATDLGLVHGDTHFGIFTTMRDGELARYSPGTIAFMLILDETVERGIGFYDIGVGEFAYKERLKGRAIPLYEAHEALSWRGHLALANAALRRGVRIVLSRYPALRSPARKLRGSLSAMRRWLAVGTIAVVDLTDWQAASPLAGIA